MSPSDQPSSNREERLAELKREAALLERELDGDRGEAAVSTSTKRSSAAQRTVPIDGSSAAAVRLWPYVSFGVFFCCPPA